jgi:hypothetical protein
MQPKCVEEDFMVDKKNNKFNPSRDHSAGADQGGQQGESQSSAPPLGSGIGSGRAWNPLPRLPLSTALPLPKVSAGEGDGDNPRNPGGKSNP